MININKIVNNIFNKKKSKEKYVLIYDGFGKK